MAGTHQREPAKLHRQTMGKSDKAEIELRKKRLTKKNRSCFSVPVLEAFTQADVSIYFSNEICLPEWFPD